MAYTYTSVDRVLSKIDRDFGMDGISESDAIEWIGEALEGIGVSSQYEEAVAFIEIANHQCTLPTNFHAIIQVAKNNCWVKERLDSTGVCAATVVPIVTPNPLAYPAPSCPIVLDCNGQPLQDYDLAYYRPYFDLQWEYGAWTSTSIYRGCFKPVVAATGSFKNIICTNPKQEVRQLNDNSELTYTIIAGEVLRFNFCEGQIALSYLKFPLDPDTGYPLIPDNYSFLQALTAYVTLKVVTKKFYNNREGAKSQMDAAEAQWQWYCRQASDDAKMLKGIDAHQNLLNQRQYMIPRLGEYYGFFGRLGKAENRHFNNPDYRNKTHI